MKAIISVLCLTLVLAGCRSKDTDPGSPPDAPTYQSCADAERAGVAPLFEGDPGYSIRLDRNRDGVACE